MARDGRLIKGGGVALRGSRPKLIFEPLAAPLGAVVKGMDFSGEIADVVRDEVEEALHRYLLLLFRGHSVPSDEDLNRFSSAFGELNKNDVAPEQTRRGYPQIL